MNLLPNLLLTLSLVSPQSASERDAIRELERAFPAGRPVALEPAGGALEATAGLDSARIAAY